MEAEQFLRGLLYEIEEAFNRSTPNVCHACERDISYDDDPVGEIAKAVLKYLKENMEIVIATGYLPN